MSTQDFTGGSTVDFNEDDMTIDLSAVPDRAAQFLLPAGTYNASIENVEYKRSQRSNNPMLEWRFRVTEGQEGEQVNSVIFWHTVLNHPNGLSNLKAAVSAAAPEMDPSQFHPINSSPELIGRAVRVRVRNRPGQDGEPRNDISAVLPVEAGETGFLS